MRRVMSTRNRLFGLALAGLVGLPLSAQAVTYQWQGGNSTSPNGWQVDANWDVGGTPNQVFSGNPASGDVIDLSLLLTGETMERTGQLQLPGATMDVFDGAVTIFNGGGGSTTALNVGQGGNFATLNMTGGTLNLVNTNGGGAIGVVGGGDRTANLIEGELNMSGSAALTANVDINIQSGFHVTMQGSSTINTQWLDFTTGSATDALFTLQGGTVTLNDSNPVRSSGLGGGSGNRVNFTGLAGAGTVIHTDNSDATKNLASKVGTGFFQVDGTTISNTTAYVNRKRLDITNTGATEDTLTTVAAPTELQIWDEDADASWNLNTNWDQDIVPDGTTAQAQFQGFAISQARTVTVDTTVDVNKMILVGGQQYTIATAAGQNINLAGTTPTVEVANNTHVISGDLSGTAGMTKTGAGTLILSGNNAGLSGAIDIQAGNLTVTDDAPLGSVPISISSGAFLNLQGDGAGTGYSGAFDSTLTGNGEVRIGQNATVEAVTLDDTAMAGFDGVVSVRGGTVAVDSNTDLGTATGPVWINFATGEMQLSNNITLGDTFNLGSRSGAEAHLHNVSGDNTITGSVNGVGGNANHNIKVTAGSLTISNSSTPAIISDDNDEGTFAFDVAPGASVKVGDETNAGAGRITGAVDVTVTGGGTLTVATAQAVTPTTFADSYHTGSTTVSGNSTLEVRDDGSDNGELFSSSINVQSGAAFDVDDFGTYSLQPTVSQTLGGAGTVKANTLQVLEGTSVTPGDSIGTLTIDGGLKLTYVDTGTTSSNNDGRLNFELTSNGNGTNDLIDVVNTTGSGNLDILMVESTLDQFVVNVTPVDGVLDTVNNYTLIQYAGLLNNDAGSNGDGSNFTANVLDNLGNTLNTRHTFSVSTATSGEVQLDVNNAALTTTWIGNSTGLWSVDDNMTDWDSDLNLSGDTDFHDLDNVTFDNNGVTKNVAIQSPVAPGSITINNTAGNDYEFTGAAINGFGGLTKNGDGTVTFRNQNSYAGDTHVNAGTMVIAGDHINGAHTINVANGATLQVGDGTSAGNIGQSYTINVASTGTLEIVDDNGFFGSAITGAGTINTNEDLRYAGDTTSFTGTVNQLSGNLDIDDNAQNFNAATTINLNGGNMNSFPGANGRTVNGTVNVIDGNIRVGNADATLTFSGNVNVTDTSTTFRADGDSQLVIDGNLDIAGGSAVQADSLANLGTGRGMVINGNLTGSGTLNKWQPGGLQLNGTANTFTGNINVNVGELVVGAGSDLGAAANITVAEGATLDVSAAGGLTLSGQNLVNNSSTTVIGDINATAGSTVSGNGVFANNLSATGSTVQVGAASIATVVDQGLVARYDFEPGAETTDSSINSNDLTFGASASGTTSSAAVGTGAGSLTDNTDNDGNRITLPNAADPNGGAARTYSFWFNPGTTGQENNATMFGGGLNSNGQRFDIKFNNADLLRIEIQGTGVNFATTPVGTENDGLWHHLAVTVPLNGNIDQFKLFLDGAELANDGSGNENITLNTAGANAFLGDSHNGGADRNFQGLLDDVQIYNKVLTPTEIADIYNNPGNAAATTFVFTPETMTVDGDYSQDATSTLKVDLVDTADFDKLAVGGTATLGGGLDMDFEQGEFALGDEAVILTSNILSGTFDQTQITGFTLTAPTEPSAIAVLYEDSGDVDTDADQVRLFATYRGDANGDGDVDLIDLDRLGSNWFATPGTVTWGQADFNYDGDVDLLDLNVLGQNWFATPIVAPESAAPAVPEPASVLLLGLGALALSRKRRG